MLTFARQKGYTIIEILVVLSAMGVLITLSVFAYGTWRTNVAKAEVTNDLKQIAGAMKNAQNFDNAYPILTAGSTFDDAGPAANQKIYVSSPGVILRYKSGTATQYCVDAVSKARSDVTYYISVSTTSDGIPTAGSCP